MAPTPKTNDRRKSGSKAGLVVTLNVPSSQLREIFPDESPKEETPEEPKPTVEAKDSPAPSAAPAISNGDAASDSNAATPAAEGTPAAMAPPEAPEGKKKGVKRAANTNGDGTPKPRGKPGPKKKPRLEDGTIDHAAVRQAAAHKLGPKANQGAINAGLRALDRSGKPCRKWAKGGFTLKSFTGVVWEIPRWTAPPKPGDEEGKEESGANSADGSNKENKENGHDEKSASASNVGGDTEMQSVPSINASSPAPVAVAASS